MKRWLWIAALFISFVALLPLSWELASSYFFNHPFDENSFDPVLLVCEHHIEALQWREIAGKEARVAWPACTFQVTPSRQAWVESAVKQLQSPVPGKSAWIIHVQQLGEDHQRIDLQLLGDGIVGMIYEVRHGVVAPLKTRGTGPGGAFIVLGINACLWGVFWLIVWFVMRKRQQARDVLSRLRS